jgi:hypothetical protein
MCEKNLERKQLSLFPNDDIDEESVIDDNIGDNINTDDDAVIVKTSKRKRRSKADKYCSTCNQNITLLKKNDGLKYNDKYHQVMVKDYCKEHENTYSDHKCKPHWCGDCGYLIKYDIEVTHEQEVYE